MTEDVRHLRAAALAEDLVTLRAESPVGNDLLSLAGEGRLTMEHLRRLVGIELQCHVSELAAYGTIISRFPHHPTTGLYLDLGRLVYEAHFKLRECATVMGIPEERIYRWPSGPSAHAFSGLISWLALHGGQADNALAMYADMTTYFPDCVKLLDRLGGTDLKMPDEFVDYYRGEAPDEMIQKALDVVEFGLAQGEAPAIALERARLTDEHIGRFWQAAADD
ncbi:hypothetical protein SMC26_14400 [Actinomadura fulvescens]|uniref:Transcriptional regulator n=1 Tax=Actinomadura fulvescens TaxID=46160 RepID=A0ABP6CEP3_9ACTN